ncbi:MAG: LicD family protein [Lactobacillus sp.]|nr:LicD family protein [Lactobacillus sp.]
MEMLDVKQIQGETLKMLKDFDDLCTNLELNYFIAYGSLIGAIRHKGFIPWDDDIDIWMPRKDFDKLLKYEFYKDIEFNKYKICTRSNTKNYAYGMARFSNQEFKYVTTDISEKDVDMGLFIDIYPLDNYCSSKEEAYKLHKKFKILNKEYFFYLSGKSNTVLKTIPRMILHMLIRLVHGKNWDQRIDKKINSYLEKYTNKDDRFIGVPVWELRFEPFEKDLFVGRKRVVFENINVWIPEKSDIILKKMYGNYMELPPISEQMPHHGYKVYRRS